MNNPYQLNVQPYTIMLNAIPYSGHDFPLIKVGRELQKRGHRIIYSTSESRLTYLGNKIQGFETVALHEDPTVAWRPSNKGPPLYIYYYSWINELRVQIRRLKPDIIIADLFSIAIAQIAEDENIKLIVNAAVSTNCLDIFCVPNSNNNFSLLGYTLYRHIDIALEYRKKTQFIDRVPKMITSHLTLIHSFPGLDNPSSYPPNMKMIGLTESEEVLEPISEELQQWMAQIRLRNLEIVYVTFGSMMAATKPFVDHMYYGLKKTGKAVIWGLRTHNLPEKNDLFYVKEWLPQGALLKYPDIKVVITHCGFGGVTECILAEKPMLALPMFGDQPSNASMLEKRGLGIILQSSDSSLSGREYNQIRYTHQELQVKIDRLIRDPSFVNNLRKLRRLGLEEGGLEKACLWVEYVGKYGYDHLIDKNTVKAVDMVPVPLVKYFLVAAVIGGLAFTWYKQNNRSLKNIF